MKINRSISVLSFLIVSALMISVNSYAEVKLPNVLGSNMVIQRQQETKVWGWADSREKVTVTFNGVKKMVKTGKDGKWLVVLPEMEAGGPYDMVIKGKNTITLNNILVGDVWVCSGQSNMEWNLANTNNAEEEILNANYPEIRIFDVPRNLQLAPVEDIPAAEWKECSSQSIPGFSSVGYFFGRHIHKEIGVPIGLIGSNWGGTNVETWISPEMASTDEQMSTMIEDIKGIDPNELVKKMEEKRLALIASMGELKEGMVDGKAVWAEEKLDISDWKDMEIPGLWEKQGLEGLNGVVWFRKSFELTELQAKNNAKIFLGPIDDSDWTYINGKLIGETYNKYNEDRVYVVPAEVLKAGKNVLTVRVEDPMGGGGFYGDKESIKIVFADTSIPLAGTWKYRVSSAGFKVAVTSSLGPNDKPTLLYNGMINPIINYAVKGAIWYQGESNSWNAYRYRTRFPMMIRDWRSKWGNEELGFYFVQLANFKPEKSEPVASDWAELREAQTMTLYLPYTGMAVTIDIGEADDIHPRNKQDVGKRLALAALHTTYGKDLVYSAPVFKDVKIENGKVQVEFDMMGSELVVDDKYGYVKGFAIAGSDQTFYWAQGVLKDGKVFLWSPEVKNPVAVRYAWADNPEDANLFNKEGLPVGPFRSDKWTGMTEGR